MWLCIPRIELALISSREEIQRAMRLEEQLLISNERFEFLRLFVSDFMSVESNILLLF